MEPCFRPQSLFLSEREAKKQARASFSNPKPKTQNINPLTIISLATKHWLTAKRLNAIHSPFVFEFATEVLPHVLSPDGRKVEALRHQLKRSKEVISYQDHGAGRGGNALAITEATVGQLAATASRRPRMGELLHRICAHYQPRHCLEFGTHLGISTLYQVTALKDAHFVTMEGAASLATKAAAHFASFEVNPKVMVGEFAETLLQLKQADFHPGYVFIDGNHRYEPTMAYFEELLPMMQDGGLMVFDDIYWSREMRRAWEEICGHPEVSVSIDLFTLGLCWVKKAQAKEHFRLIP